MTPSPPRYCSTCGALLTAEAALCGECGTRLTASPFEKRPTEAPQAWSSGPPPRRAPASTESPRVDDEDRIELVSRESLRPPRPGATTVRPTDDQYDRRMSTTSASPTPSWSAPPASNPAPSGQLDPPLDGCEPAGLLQRLGAALIDGVISSLLAVPLLVGLVLIGVNAQADLLAQILTGIGAALVLAVWLVFAWLQGQRGFTPGKAILGLRAVRMSSGRTIGFLRALGRAILLGIPVVQLVAIVMILVDARTRRGLHDRAVDSIVLGIRTGRNPLLARPDDYARHADAHYIPQGPSAVAAHDNLMSQPGTPWGIGSSEAPVYATGWETSGPEAVSDGVIERSPWAPSTGESRADARHVEDPAASWPAPAAQHPGQRHGQAQGQGQTRGQGQGQGPSEVHGQHAPAAPVPASEPGAYGTPWGSPSQHGHEPRPSSQPPYPPQAPQQPQASPPSAWGSPEPASADPVPPPSPWGTPAAAAAPQSSAWGSPDPGPGQPAWSGSAHEEARPAESAPAVPQQQLPQDDVPQSPFAQSPSAQSPFAEDRYPADGYVDPIRSQAPEQSEPARDPWSAVPPSAPEDLGAVSSQAHGLDATRAVEDLEDLERTRISRPLVNRTPRLRVGIDGEDSQELTAPVVVGRNPTGEYPATSVLAVADSTRSVSKVHLLLEVSDDAILVSDLGSTNGTSLRRPDGSTVTIEPGSPTRIETGAELALGDRTLVVELLR